MIALDSNVLLRYLVQDGNEQARIATKLIEVELSQTDRGFISLPVFCETLWALRTTYKQGREQIRQAAELLLAAGQLQVEASHIIARAVATEGADIADAIIHYSALAHGCVKTVTFDRKFSRLGGVELLAAGDE